MLRGKGVDVDEPHREEWEWPETAARLPVPAGHPVGVKPAAAQTGRSAGGLGSRQSIGLLTPVSRWWRSSHLPSTSRLIM